MLTPTWLKWTLDTPERQSDEDTIADINNQEDLTGPKLGSIGVLTRPNRLFDYQLKLSNNAANRSITWCALEIADTLPNDSNPHTILFHDPRAIAPTSVKLKANTPTWATQLPYDNTPPDTLIVDTIVIEYDSKPFNAVMGNWKTSQEKNSIECSSQLHVLADSISDEIGVTCTSSVTLTILAQLVNGQINISAKLSGLFGKDALFQSIASKLDQEVDSLTLDLIAHKELHDVKSKLNHVRSNLRGTTSTNAKIITNFKAAIVTFVGDALQKKKSDLIGENIKDQRIVLDKLEIRLLELPTKLDEIRVQKDTMISLKRQLDEIHIASMRVKHPISELVKKQRGAPKSLVILDFVDANQRIPQTAGKGTK